MAARCAAPGKEGTRDDSRCRSAEEREREPNVSARQTERDQRRGPWGPFVVGDGQTGAGEKG